MQNSEVFMAIISLLVTAIGVLTMLMLKWIRDDLKDLRTDIKEIKSTLVDHGNRLTAIETGLKMFEWFNLKNHKVEGD